jgi:hypothetical protein
MKNLKFYKILGLLVILASSFNSFAQISVPNVAFTYNQDFNSLAISGTGNAWTNNVTLVGWQLFNKTPAAITTYDSGTGSATAGAFMSYGSPASNERSLGGLASGGAYFGSPASGTVAGWIAVGFTNNTGSTITSFNVAFDGEQWRNGGNVTSQSMVLQYGEGASFTMVSNWITPGGNFDWSSPIATATAAAVDGNGAGKVSGKGGVISGLTWSAGSTLWIRWVENNDTGNDHGLAIDDFVLNNIITNTSCSISSADFLNISTCNDNGTPAISTDDYYVADVSVTFSNAPATGFLQFEPGNDAISGGGALSVSTTGLTSPYTFTGVRFKADNTPTFVEIEFSAEPTTCVLTKVGPTVASCSAGVCNVSDVALVNVGSCNNNGTPINGSDDYFTADVLVNYSVKPNTGTLSLSGDNIGGVTSINANLIGSSSYTFTNVRFAADSGPISISASFSDVMGCSFANNNAGTAPGPCTFIAPCTFPFFSEYIEGSGNNKCLEIYNPSSSVVDLASEGYKIEMYFNGNPVSTLTLNLTGTIQPGDAYVVCNSSATSDFTSQADQIGTGGWFNGDDAVVLRNSSGITDIIGQIGVDPGTNWSNSGIETSEQTLRRASFVQKGDNNGSDVFNPANEWESYPQNTLWGLGYHGTECQPSLPNGWNPSSIGCNSGTSAYNSNTNTWTQTSNCFNPASGADDLTFVFEELCGDGEIIAQYMGVTPFGFAGLMMRENATASSKHVWLFNRANSNTSWSIRSTTGAAPLIQAKPHLNRTWMKLTRTGNVFKGYLSTNGLTWQLMFQSATTMNECLLVGIATHSNVDGNTVTSMFKNVEVLSNRQRLSINNLTEMDLMAENRTYKSNGINVYPNPIGEKLTIEFNGCMVTAESTLMQIVDLNGRLVLQQTMENRNEDKISLDVSILNAGIYFLKLSAGPFNEVIKLVKH